MLGIEVTGHLCSVGFREAAAIGIDNLEHGLLVDTEFHPGKQPDECSAQRHTQRDGGSISVQPMRDMIADLVRHNVAITSTLSVFEVDGSCPPIEQRFLDSVSPEAAVSYLSAWTRPRRRRIPLLSPSSKGARIRSCFVKAGVQPVRLRPDWQRRLWPVSGISVTKSNCRRHWPPQSHPDSDAKRAINCSANSTPVAQIARYDLVVIEGNLQRGSPISENQSCLQGRRWLRPAPIRIPVRGAAGMH